MPEFIGGQPGSGIAGVDTGDEYEDALTLGPAQDVAQITFNVIGNPAFVQFWKPVPGQPSKATLEPFERFYYANTYGVIATGVSGVRFRSYNAGDPATITAEMDFATDPTLFPGTVAGVTLTPSGGIIPPSQLETTDGVTDVVPTNELLIGAGLTLSNPAPGVAQLDAGAGGVEVTDGTIDINPASTIFIGERIRLSEPTAGVAELDGAQANLLVAWGGGMPPVAGGAGATWRVPEVDGASVTFTLQSLFARVETPGSGTSFRVEVSPAGGAFSPTTVATVTIAAAAHEATVTVFPTPTITTGQLLRIVYVVTGTTGIYTVELEGEGP